MKRALRSNTRRLDLEVDDAELQARRERWQAPAPMFDRGGLQIFRNAGPLSQDAVLVQTKE